MVVESSVAKVAVVCGSRANDDVEAVVIAVIFVSEPRLKCSREKERFRVLTRRRCS